MSGFIQKLLAKRFLTLIVSTLLIILILGVNYYIGIKNAEREARKVVNSELRLVEQHMLGRFMAVDVLLQDMKDLACQHLDNPDEMLDVTLNILERDSSILATAIAFLPDFYPEKGKFYEPVSYREGDSIISEQYASESHNYMNMDWYIGGKSVRAGQVNWSQPYIDKGVWIMSFSKPLCNFQNETVGVLDIDVSLEWMKNLLEEARPYRQSMCQLINKEGEVLVSSDDFEIEDSKYFIDEKQVGKSDLRLVLVCPKDAIYGTTWIQNLIMLGLLLLGGLLLGLIVHRSIETVIHLDEVRNEQMVVEREMLIAHNIQMDILRNDFPKDFYATLLPMKDVGGDLYDFCQRGDTLFFIIGDVSGKGIPAAMTMAATINLFRMSAHHFSTPSDIVSEINRVLSERNPSLIFVTAFVGKLDMTHGLFTFCNAGHNPPIVNGMSLGSAPEIPIGYDANFCFHQYGVLFPEGSYGVLYTDGIIESRNAERKLMGSKRLLSIVEKCQHKSVREMTDYILHETHKYVGSFTQTDDMTLACVVNSTPVQSPALVIDNDIEEIVKMKLLLREYCECLGCDHRLMKRILLAIEEAVANVINYAYPKGCQGRIEIDMLAVPARDKQHPGDLTITISDSGQPFNPLAGKSVDVEQITENRQVGGLGIYLYQQLMDEVVYTRTEDGHNVLTLTKIISKS